MNVSCNRDRLAQTLQLVGRAVSAKTTTPILSGILMEPIQTNLRLTATDLELGIQTSIEAETMGEGACVIPAKYMSEIVRRLPEDRLSIDLNRETMVVTLTCGNAVFRINALPPDEFPTIPTELDGTTFDLDGACLRKMVRQTAFAASVDATRPPLAGILLEIQPGKIRMVATDGFRLAFREEAFPYEVDGERTAIVPAHTFVELARSLTDDSSVKIVLADNQVVFKSGETTWMSRLIEGQFPNYNRVIPKECKTRVRLDPMVLLDVVERVAVLGKDEFSSVKCAVRGYTFSITANTPEIGHAEDEIPIQIDGEEVEVNLRSKYLSDSLKTLDCKEIVMEFTGSAAPTCIRESGSNDLIHLVMPVTTV